MMSTYKVKKYVYSGLHLNGTLLRIRSPSSKRSAEVVRENTESLFGTITQLHQLIKTFKTFSFYKKFDKRTSLGGFNIFVVWDVLNPDRDLYQVPISRFYSFRWFSLRLNPKVFIY